MKSRRSIVIVDYHGGWVAEYVNTKGQRKLAFDRLRRMRDNYSFFRSWL